MIDPVGIKAKAVDRSIAPAAPTPAATPVRAPVAPVADGDAAALSGVARELAARPPVDENRVALIKKAIAEGTFPILPATIADRLLALRYDWMSNEQA